MIQYFRVTEKETEKIGVQKQIQSLSPFFDRLGLLAQDIYSKETVPTAYLMKCGNDLLGTEAAGLLGKALVGSGKTGEQEILYFLDQKSEKKDLKNILAQMKDGILFPSYMDYSGTGNIGGFRFSPELAYLTGETIRNARGKIKAIFQVFAIDPKIEQCIQESLRGIPIEMISEIPLENERTEDLFRYFADKEEMILDEFNMQGYLKKDTKYTTEEIHGIFRKWAWDFYQRDVP